MTQTISLELLMLNDLFSMNAIDQTLFDDAAQKIMSQAKTQDDVTSSAAVLV